MAALSVQYERSGTWARSPASPAVAANRARSSLLAATPATETDGAGADLAGGPHGLGDQHVDHGVLEGGGHVGVRHLRVAADVVDHRGLHPAEREVEAVVHHGPGEADGRSVPLGSQAVDDGAARIAEAEVTGHLVERLAGRIVDRRAEVAVSAGLGHLDEHRVTARDQQHHQGQLEAGVLQEGGEEVTLHVVDAHIGHPPGHGHRLGCAHADQQGADQPGPAGGGDGGQVGRGHACPVEGLGGHRLEPLQVGPAGHLGHDATECGM